MSAWWLLLIPGALIAAALAVALRGRDDKPTGFHDTDVAECWGRILGPRPEDRGEG